MDDLTVIYYTAHLESDTFEARTRETLAKSIDGLPLISVTHRPLDFGQNICVGEVGACSQNAFRQLQIGAKAAATRFVCNAEADWLYPPDYFRFRPERDDAFYIPDPIYVLFNQHGKKPVFGYKNKSEGAMVVNREFLIRAIDAQLTGYPLWSDPAAPLLEGRHFLPYLLNYGDIVRFTTTVPSVSFKTDKNMHRKTLYIHGTLVDELPGWGTVRQLLETYR